MERKPYSGAYTPPPRPRRRRRTFRTILILVLIILVLLAVVFIFGKDYIKLKAETIAPVLAEKKTVTLAEVQHTLEPIGELCTYEYTFTGLDKITDTRQLLGLNIPGTTHSIEIVYSGVIKAGYRVSELGIEVDNDRDVIYITLPSAEITDRYLDEDSLQYTENNNIFNPISGDEITDELAVILDAETRNAEAAGLYGLAEENAKMIISGFLSVFEDYTVIFK